MNDYSLCTYVIGRKNATDQSIQLLGTAFMVGQNLITAFHVINGDDRELYLITPNIGNIEMYQDVDDRKCYTFPLKVKSANPLVDLCVLEIVNFTFHVTGTTWKLGTLDEIHVGTRVGIWGFPHCVDGRRVLTYQETELGAKMLMSSSGLKNKYGTINIQTRPGQSGSPVYNLTSGNVVGVLVGAYAPESGIRLGSINPYELNQTSYCISAEYIPDML